MTKPVLILGFGNPSRGDDAVGPLLIEFLAQHAESSAIELITDFQLQIEHALDLQNRQLVLFMDASVNAAAELCFQRIRPAKDPSYSSHALSPVALLDVYHTITGQQPPPSFLLTLKAEQFELGSGLSAAMQNRFQTACEFVTQLLGQPQLQVWQQRAIH